MPPAAAPSPTPPDKAVALQAWVDQQERLYRVAGPLLINNTELCPRHVRNLLGFTAKNQYSYTDDLTAVAHSALGLDARLRVMSVLPGSGAEQAGLRKGDVLLASGVDPLPEGPNAEHEAASLIRAEMQGRSSIDLSILRDGERVALEVPLTSACAMSVDTGNSGQVNSYADGNRVLVTQGMLKFVLSDEDLAYVLAKEIAHNILAPLERADMAAVIDRLKVPAFDSASPPVVNEVRPYPATLDADADRLALYLLARAGVDIEHAPAFWKRLADTYPETVSGSYTALHPATAERLSVMTETIRAIKDKQAQNLPLLPADAESGATSGVTQR
ncbi:MAG TPA: M48 family metallopeptidase [Noviherbaspirillum sp.]|nr:M48 family metallopeptidase [Noviherbaspirillum sp.]